MKGNTIATNGNGYREGRSAKGSEKSLSSEEKHRERALDTTKTDWTIKKK